MKAKADIDKRALEEVQSYIDLECPDMELHNVWIADWVFVR